jgi:hypothetical protein
MNKSNETREELRKRLKDKIREKQNTTSANASLAKKIKDDPKSALLSFGVDNADILNNAQSLLKNPEATLRSLKGAMSNHGVKHKDTDDDEELPPE